jgi:peptide/nickel transport system substrate-binding protein
MDNESSPQEDKKDESTPLESTKSSDDSAVETSNPGETISPDGITDNGPEISDESSKPDVTAASDNEDSKAEEVKPVAAANSTLSQDNNQASQTVSSAGPPKKKSKKKLIILLAIVVVIILVVAGYLIYKNHHKKSSSSVLDIQNLSIGIEGGDLGAQVYPDANQTGGNSLLNAQIFDGLVQYENESQIKPDLSSGWSNPSNTTWLFNIKQGIKFHDGHMLTPADVVYSLNLMKKQSTNANDDYAQSFATTIKSAKTVGSNQVLVTTTQPDPVFLNKLTYLYIVDPNLPKGDNQSMAGTGAYEFKPGTKMSNNNVQLVAFNDYHGGAVMTKSVSITKIATNAAMIADFKAHKFDIVGQIPYQNRNLPNSYLYTQQDDSVSFLALNTNQAPLNNKLVREAIEYTLDPTLLTTNSKAIQIGQMIPPSITGYNPNILPVKQNITKAKQLLAQAGYPNGITFTLNSDPESGAFNSRIVNQLKEAGITVNINNISNITDQINDLVNGTAQSTQIEYASNTLDGADVLESTVLPANYTNPAFYNLVNKASSTLEPSTRLKLLQQAETIVSQNVPVVPLYFDDDLYLMNKPYVMHQDMLGIYMGTYFNKIHLNK